MTESDVIEWLDKNKLAARRICLDLLIAKYGNIWTRQGRGYKQLYTVNTLDKRG